MKEYIIIAMIGLVGCQNRNSGKILKNDELQNDTIYDVLRGELVHETEDTLWFEPYVKKIPKIRRIFRKGKNYVYEAIYRDSNGTILSNSEIKVIPSGERIDFAPERQDRVTYEFKDYKKDKAKLEGSTLNASAEYWVEKQEEGIIENSESVWIHPFRSNQYLFTEVAPFPEIILPLEIGKEWDSNLSIGEGWGEWENTSGNCTYKVVEKSNYLIDSAIIECWLITSNSEYSFGNSKLDYKFNEEFGFVEMNYKNYLNETLDIKMIRVETK